MTTNIYLHSHTTFLFLIAFHCLLPLCYFQELAMQTQRNAAYIGTGIGEDWRTRIPRIYLAGAHTPTVIGLTLPGST